MRSPEHRNNYTNKTGQNYENEISSRYKTPGAFTVLPPDDDTMQDPPAAPQPYRLTPSSRRHKNMSFAILAEPSSVPGSRSPSPTGRVSPFRGRGFNPIGSRHASPVPSPPPQEGFTPYNDSPRHSKIPRLSRRGSATVFGEKVTDYELSPTRRRLNAQLSQSLTNIAPRKVAARPPPSPRRPPGYSKSAFQRLSPIVGSSPEPSQSQSSPKLNTGSQQSKFSSPGRSRSFVNKPPRNPSRPASKAASRNPSREPSPSKNPTSPTRIPIKNYRNVQAKVNSFSRTTKPKVPPKPQVLSEDTEDSESAGNRRRMERRESVKSRTNSKSNINNNSNNNKTNRNVTKDSNGNTVNKSNNNNSNKSVVNKNTEGQKDKINSKNTSDKGNNNTTSKNTDSTTDDTNDQRQEEVIKKSESSVKLSDLLQPSTTAVVSSTTTTVTQPLKIEAKIDTEPVTSVNSDNKNIAPMVDGRILSATSVSNAMNKMNDTVINTQTLMKESGLTKLSPAANTIIAMSNDASKQTHPASTPTNPALDTKNATAALPTVEETTTRTVDNINSNHVTSTGIIPSARVLEQHVQNNMSKLISPENKLGNSITKSANDRIIEARTVVAHDVKPIKITVKEKPMDVEVQSGNIRFDTSNGLNERPGLPPPHQPTNDPQQQPQEPPKGNVCTRFISTCKKKMSCKRSKKQKDEQKEELKKDDEGKEKTGCFNCRRKKPDVIINVENTENEPKKKLWDRMKCCGKNKVGDKSSCFPTGKRKESWAGERRDSILSDIPAKKSRCSCCTGFFRKLFCLDRCKKKKPKLEEIPDSRRASMLSKKKSLTPPVVEDTKPKLDASLVEHTSHMKAAIPVLPVPLAWFCLVMNCIAPGTGTVFSGMFCLCIGKPRFSQKDGFRPRIGAFIIDLVIGIGQCFTVLFCLVGWGWSIWWGVIMLKLAKKHKKIKILEANAQAQEGSRQVPAANQNHSSRDPERGS